MTVRSLPSRGRVTVCPYYSYFEENLTKRDLKEHLTERPIPRVGRVLYLLSLCDHSITSSHLTGYCGRTVLSLVVTSLPPVS